MRSDGEGKVARQNRMVKYKYAIITAHSVDSAKKIKVKLQHALLMCAEIFVAFAISALIQHFPETSKPTDAARNTDAYAKGRSND